MLRMTGVLRAAAVFLAMALPAAAQDDPYVRTAGGVSVYLGVVPEEVVHEYPRHRPEHRMLKKSEGRPGEHHLVVALFDAQTGARITEARVHAYLVGVGRSRSERTLEPTVLGGVVTYCNFLAMPGPGPYEIAVEVLRPGQAKAVRVSFTYPIGGP